MSDTAGYDIPDGLTDTSRALLLAVREGRDTDVPGLIGALTDAERRKCLPVLKAWRGVSRDDRGAGSRAVCSALRAAGAACFNGAAAAAQWLAISELWWANRDHTLVHEAMAHRDPEWLGRVACRLAERRGVAENDYPLIAALVRTAGCEPPTTDAVVLGWEYHAQIRRTPLVTGLREDPFLEVMVPRLFEVPEAGANFQYGQGDDGWPGALAALAAEGRLSRRMLVDGCLSRLTRGDRPGIVRGFLALLTALELTEEERAAHTLTWVRMLPDAPAPVAARAQEALAALDEAGRLETEHLLEAAQAALLRPEKKIVRAQLSLLDKAMRRDRSRTDALLLAVADAFAHEEHSLQERALAVVVRHRGHASGSVLAELAESAGRLSPDLRKRAAEALGVAPADDAGAPAAGADALPPAPGAERLGPPPRTAAELAEETGVLLHGGGTPAREEWLLNALVVHARADLAGLRAALEPVLARRPRPLMWEGARVLEELEFVALSVMGTITRKDRHHLRDRGLLYQCPHSADASVLRVRAVEIGAAIGDGSWPFLLATPTWSTGTIDPSELVARIAEYERSGAEPGPYDLEQALLRLDREVPAGARAAAERLTSPAGRRLAAWFASGGLPDPAVSRVCEPVEPGTFHPGPLVSTEALSGHDDRPEPFRSLLGAHDPAGNPCKCHRGGRASPHALAVLPQHREVMAARMVATFAVLAEFDDLGEGTPVLPALAASGGPAGPATHLVLAYGLGARRFEEQLHAVDAVLVMAARGQLDTVRLGLDIAELTGLRRIKAQRVVTALREAARAGAHAAVWAVLAAALPPLLSGEAPHGLSAVLTLAAECAELSGVRASIPGIDELAARPGSSQLVKQARRIRAAVS